MAEMQLLLLLCVDATGMLITGDSAQSIEKGVAFRFKDVRSIFYKLNEQLLQLERQRVDVSGGAAALAAVTSPIPTIDYLAHNYRSGAPHTLLLTVLFQYTAL